MPLVDRTDSVLVVIDTQPGFIEQKSMAEQERSQSVATFERLAWLAVMSRNVGRTGVTTRVDVVGG
jgi:nicotinamidase-related amidase